MTALAHLVAGQPAEHWQQPARQVAALLRHAIHSRPRSCRRHSLPRCEHNPSGPNHGRRSKSCFCNPKETQHTLSAPSMHIDELADGYPRRQCQRAPWRPVSYQRINPRFFQTQTRPDVGHLAMAISNSQATHPRHLQNAADQARMLCGPQSDPGFVPALQRLLYRKYLGSSWITIAFRRVLYHYQRHVRQMPSTLFSVFVRTPYRQRLTRNQRNRKEPAPTAAQPTFQPARASCASSTSATPAFRRIVANCSAQ